MSEPKNLAAVEKELRAVQDEFWKMEMSRFDGKVSGELAQGETCRLIMRLMQQIFEVRLQMGRLAVKLESLSDDVEEVTGLLGKRAAMWPE